MREHAFSYFSKPFSLPALADMLLTAAEEPCWDDGIEILSATSDWIHLAARCDLKTAERLIQFMHEIADLPEPENEAVAFAFREILMNAIEYGGHFRSDQYVEISYIRAKHMVMCRVKDPGEGFTLDEIEHAAIANPDDDPIRHIELREAKGMRPGGYGVLLSRKLNAQPATTAVGVGYMSNATIQIVQNFTADHAAAAKAIRLPRGNLSAMDSPYLSLISLIKGWPEQKVRREVLMVSDGIERLRNDRMSNRQTAPSASRASRNTMPSVPMSTGMTTMSPDVDSASTAAQRYGVIVHGIYATGVGRAGRNGWEAQIGQSGVAKITDEAGGEYFSLGTQNLVSFKPYLDRLQRILDNQYYLVFRAIPRSKAALQRVNISTDAPAFEVAAADSVWVPVANQAAPMKKD